LSTNGNEKSNSPLALLGWGNQLSFHLDYLPAKDIPHSCLHNRKKQFVYFSISSKQPISINLYGKSASSAITEMRNSN